MALSYGQGSTMSVSLEGPFGGGGVSGKLTSIVLPAADWKGGESPYSQAVTVEGISVNSVIDLHPTLEQISLLHNTGLMAVNDGGSVTVYAVGDKPEEDIQIQATLTEVISV